MIRELVLCLTMLSGANALANDNLRACTPCHGTDGYSRVATTPHLAGQRAAYLVDQMLSYQLLTRRDPTGGAHAKFAASRQEITDLANYYAALPRTRPRATQDTPVAAGEQLFTTERCNICHTDTKDSAATYATNAPILNGQPREFLTQAMREINAGQRRGDNLGLMRQIFRRLSEADRDAIATYLATR
jgi:cytochrome c553